jgi:antitoxin VapB
MYSVYTRRVAGVALSIRNRKAEALAREAARQGNETITDAIIHALEERLARFRGRRVEHDLAEQILSITGRCSRLPDLDPRTAEEILGYDQNGTAG